MRMDLSMIKVGSWELWIETIKEIGPLFYRMAAHFSRKRSIEIFIMVELMWSRWSRRRKLGNLARLIGIEGARVGTRDYQCLQVRIKCHHPTIILIKLLCLTPWTRKLINKFIGSPNHRAQLWLVMGFYRKANFLWIVVQTHPQAQWSV